MKIDILTPIRFGGPQKWGDDLVKIYEKNGISAENIHNLFGILRRYIYTDADIIHSTLPLSFNFQNKPIILTIHGNLNLEHHPWSFLWPKAIKNASLITVPSDFLKSELKLLNSKVIPNGIFLDGFKKVEHKNKDVLKIVCLTSFKFWDKARGVIELFKILNNLKDNTKFSLTIIGDGPFLDKVKSEIGKVNFSYEFTGFCKNPKEILENSDIFAYYSFQDTFGISIIEAMACGLPIISNDYVAIRSILPESEIAKDNIDYLKKLKKYFLLNNRKKYGNINLNKVKEFDYNIIKDKFIGVYNEIK